MDTTDFKDQVYNISSNINRNVTGILNSTTPIGIITRISIYFGIIYLIVNIIKYLYNKYQSSKSNAPWIFQGTKSARRRLVIPQDPNMSGAITLDRSQNQSGGIEFTYLFWIYVDDWTYKYGEWKHVFHKGSDNSWPLRTPGVWLHPTENNMRIYMNTFSKIDEHVDIMDIPINKWMFVGLSVKGNILDIYINGAPVKRHVLSDIPKQNYGDFYINNNRGFSGYLSNIRYLSYYASTKDILDAFKSGPSKLPCIDSGELPPYFSLDWYLKQN